MRARTLPLAILLLSTLLLAPTALASEPAVEEGVYLDDIHMLVRVEGAPAMVADTPLLLSIELSGPRSDTVREVRAAVDDAHREGGEFLVPPSTALPVTAAADLRLHQTGLILPDEGPVRLRVILDGVEAAAFDLDVLPSTVAWPDWASPEDALTFEGTDAQPQVRLRDAEGRHLPLPEDARVVVRPAAPGATAPDVMPVLDVGLSAEGRFETRTLPTGEYVVEVLAPSIGLVPGARESLRLLVAPQEDADVYQRSAEPEDPARTPGAGVAVVAAAALAAAVLLARHRPRA